MTLQSSKHPLPISRQMGNLSATPRQCFLVVASLAQATHLITTSTTLLALYNMEHCRRSQFPRAKLPIPDTDMHRIVAANSKSESKGDNLFTMDEKAMDSGSSTTDAPGASQLSAKTTPTSHNVFYWVETRESQGKNPIPAILAAAETEQDRYSFGYGHFCHIYKDILGVFRAIFS